MKTIWKYRLELTDTQTIEVPEGFQFLTVQVQGGETCLWALVNPDQPKQKINVSIYGTGNPIESTGGEEYIGTYQHIGGAFVIHVFIQRYPVNQTI